MNTERSTFFTVSREIDSLSLGDDGREHILISKLTEDEFYISTEKLLTIFKKVRKPRDFIPFLTSFQRHLAHNTYE